MSDTINLQKDRGFDTRTPVYDKKCQHLSWLNHESVFIVGYTRFRNMESASAVEKFSQPSKKLNFSVENMGFGVHFVCLCLDENLQHVI